jgi:hypothetical protein
VTVPKKSASDGAPAKRTFLSRLFRALSRAPIKAPTAL